MLQERSEELQEKATLADAIESRTNGEYTVGWICAVSTEYVAAQTFLDERHEIPEYVSPNDNIYYALGKIGKHNVVTAVLPDGEYGIISAAATLRDILRSFLNIRIGLMVGIGGGVPSQNHDTRLGGIVVNTSWNGKGGVLQYDFGKTIQDQSFRTVGSRISRQWFYERRRVALKRSMGGMAIRLKKLSTNILEKRPKLRKEFKRPDRSNDRLYQSGFTHPLGHNTDCATVCNP